MIKILEDREKRYEEILSLIKQSRGTVLCAKINYPGTNKNTKHSQKAFCILRKEIYNEFKKSIIKEKILNGYDGESMLLIIDLPEEEVKKRSIFLELNHPLGRIFDIDVYDKNGEPLSRKQFGFSERQCIVCNRSARECIINKSHSIEEVIEIINNAVEEYGEGYEK